MVLMGHCRVLSVPRSMRRICLDRAVSQQADGAVIACMNLRDWTKRMPWFKRDPKKKLQKAYEKKMEEAMHALRNGDVRLNAQLHEEADKIREEMNSLD